MSPQDLLIVQYRQAYFAAYGKPSGNVTYVGGGWYRITHGSFGKAAHYRRAELERMLTSLKQNTPETTS